MKILIKESKIEDLAYLWLDRNYGEMSISQATNRPMLINFNVDDRKIMTYITNNGIVDADIGISTGLNSVFGYGPDKAELILINWLKMRYYLNATLVTFVKKFN